MVAGALAKLARTMLSCRQPETAVCKQGPGLAVVASVECGAGHACLGVRGSLVGNRQLLEAGTVYVVGVGVERPPGTAMGGLVECSRNRCMPRDGWCQVAQGLYAQATSCPFDS